MSWLVTIMMLISGVALHPISIFVASTPAPNTHAYLESTVLKGSGSKTWQGLIDRLKCVPPGLAFHQKLLEQGSYMKGVVRSHYVHANQRQKLVKSYSRFFLCAHVTITTNPWKRWGKPSKSRAWRPMSCPWECCSMSRYQHRPQGLHPLLIQPSLCLDDTRKTEEMHSLVKAKRQSTLSHVDLHNCPTDKLLVNWHSRKGITSISNNWQSSYSTSRFNWETPSQANMQILNINKWMQALVVLK